MRKPLKCAAGIIAILSVMCSPAVLANEAIDCPPAPTTENVTTTVETGLIIDAIKKFFGNITLNFDFKRERKNIIKEFPNADLNQVVLTFANTICKFIGSDTHTTGAEKAALYSKLMEAALERVDLGPIANTDGAKTDSSYLLQRKIMVASLDTSGLVLAGIDWEEEFKKETGYLRKPPFYVTDNNKYFVIVGSARSEEEGIAMMNKLKAKAPQYEFALYPPYGSNPWYGIMMASWVPKNVAQEALDAARSELAPDAYLWACPSVGERC